MEAERFEDMSIEKLKKIAQDCFSEVHNSDPNNPRLIEYQSFVNSMDDAILALNKKGILTQERPILEFTEKEEEEVNGGN